MGRLHRFYKDSIRLLHIMGLGISSSGGFELGGPFHPFEQDS